jgi:hypothetical protein
MRRPGDDPPSKAKPPKAFIEVRREEKFVGHLLKVNVLIDGQELGELSNGQSELYETSPGEHSIEVHVNKQKSRKFAMTLQADEGAVFECAIGTFAGGIGLKCVEAPNEHSVKIAQVVKSDKKESKFKSSILKSRDTCPQCRQITEYNTRTIWFSRKHIVACEHCGHKFDVVPGDEAASRSAYSTENGLCVACKCEKPGSTYSFFVAELVAIKETGYRTTSAVTATRTFQKTYNLTTERSFVCIDCAIADVEFNRKMSIPAFTTASVIAAVTAGVAGWGTWRLWNMQDWGDHKIWASVTAVFCAICILVIPIALLMGISGRNEPKTIDSESIEAMLIRQRGPEIRKRMESKNPIEFWTNMKKVMKGI